jgi:hypothetical protein
MVRKCAGKGQIEVEFVRTSDQLGNILTKALDKLKFQELHDVLKSIE